MTQNSNERSTPRWVYVFGIVFDVLPLLFAGLHIAGRDGAVGVQAQCLPSYGWRKVDEERS